MRGYMKKLHLHIIQADYMLHTTVALTLVLIWSYLVQQPCLTEWYFVNHSQLVIRSPCCMHYMTASYFLGCCHQHVLCKCFTKIEFKPSNQCIIVAFLLNSYTIRYGYRAPVALCSYCVLYKEMLVNLCQYLSDYTKPHQPLPQLNNSKAGKLQLAWCVVLDYFLKRLREETDETNRIIWPVLYCMCADSLDRCTARPVNMCLCMLVCVCLSLLCKAHPGVSLSCVTLQAHSWEK